MSLRLMSSRTFSIADFELSAGGGLMSVGLGIVGGAVVIEFAQKGSRLRDSMFMWKQKILCRHGL